MVNELNPEAEDARSTASTAPNGWPSDLLAGFRGGSRDALTEVYRLHAREVGALLRGGFSFSSGGEQRRFVGYASAFDLQDALHETFRRAFEPRARDGYDGIRPYGPYLRTIARNVVLSRFRAREVLFPRVDAPEVALDATPIGSPAHAEHPPSPERAVHDAQTRVLVEEFLASLDPEDRRLVECRFVRGLSQRDAAAELGLGRQRIRTREREIKRALLRFLRARGESGLVGATSLVGYVVGTGIAEGLSEVLR